nr:beta-1,4-glucuronyltransferase 1-like isoform X1 [Cherax quadricarinatus]
MRFNVTRLSLVLNLVLSSCVWLMFLRDEYVEQSTLVAVITQTNLSEKQLSCDWEEDEIIEDEAENSVLKKMYSDISECANSVVRPSSYQRGHYWVLENYLPAAYTFPCNNTITYTTHADYTFLNNLVPLTTRWQGPVSVAVYAPGDDFDNTINTIVYLRNCGSADITNLVTFHLYFDVSHFPSQVPPAEEVLTRKSECSQQVNLSSVSTYRYQQGLLYPVNVARNTARLAAKTYFVLPSDIELYPSINFIPEFFKMLRRSDSSSSTKPRVYVLSIFEVKEEITPPDTKTQLLYLLRRKKAIPFHTYVCKRCHNVPQAKKWKRTKEKSVMSVFHIAKRKAPFDKWEPIYVGTNAEPLYDERLSWEGKGDKMTQVGAPCTS